MSYGFQINGPGGIPRLTITDSTLFLKYSRFLPENEVSSVDLPWLDLAKHIVTVSYTGGGEFINDALSMQGSHVVSVSGTVITWAVPTSLQRGPSVLVVVSRV